MIPEGESPAVARKGGRGNDAGFGQPTKNIDNSQMPQPNVEGLFLICTAQSAPLKLPPYGNIGQTTEEEMESTFTGGHSPARRERCMSKSSPQTETVTVGHDLAGTINGTARGFELFDANGTYLHTERTIHGARRTLYERHRSQQEAAKV